MCVSSSVLHGLLCRQFGGEIGGSTSNVLCFWPLISPTGKKDSSDPSHCKLNPTGRHSDLLQPLFFWRLSPPRPPLSHPHCEVLCPKAEYRRRMAFLPPVNVGSRACWDRLHVLSSRRTLYLISARSKYRRSRRTFPICLATAADSSGNGSSGSGSDAILGKIRQELEAAEVDAFIIPSADPHNSEYTSKAFDRRSYLSGFDGSAGVAVVTRDKALLWTDGRYFLQAEQQLSNAWTLMKSGTPQVPTMGQWLATNLPKSSTVGIDPFVHTVTNTDELAANLDVTGVHLKFLKSNLVDLVWEDRPPLPSAKLRVHLEKFAGQSAADKIDLIRKGMTAENADAMLVTTLDEIAWMLNIRGGDIPCCPVALAYLLVFRTGKTVLFIDEKKVDCDVRKYLEENDISTSPYERARDVVEEVAKADLTVWLNKQSASKAMFDAANVNSKAIAANTPIPVLKAVKNEAEIAGMKNAHLEDGAALCNFFAWLETTVANGESPSEAKVAEVLESFRAQRKLFVEESFPTIAGSGANGAIIHYRAEEGKCGKVNASNLMLLDSGGQYLDGTTDVTRTFHLGQPSGRERECFTLVLRGHIAIDTAVFPESTTGFMLDSMARLPLWEAGLDYRHGTGHGVGACLNVHEGPQSISPRENKQPLLPGMIVSNEPGYYEDGSFGIRIENLLLVVEANTPNSFGGRKYHKFEKLTYVPIQTKMIDVNLLSDKEMRLEENTVALSRDASSVSSSTASRRQVLASFAGLGLGLLTGLWRGESRAGQPESSPPSVATLQKAEPQITSQCFMDIEVGGKAVGRVIIGVYGAVVPMTAENFLGLCRGDNGYGYKGSEIYRVVQGLTIQGGAATGSKGQRGKSIYGSPFRRENFIVKHTKVGTISMVNTANNENDSRFLIQTQDDAAYLDDKYVAFGRVVEGLDVIRLVEQVGGVPPTNRPSQPIKIIKSGIFPERDQNQT